MNENNETVNIEVLLIWPFATQDEILAFMTMCQMGKVLARSTVVKFASLCSIDEAIWNGIIFRVGKDDIAPTEFGKAWGKSCGELK